MPGAMPHGTQTAVFVPGYTKDRESCSLSISSLALAFVKFDLLLPEWYQKGPFLSFLQGI